MSDHPQQYHPAPALSLSLAGIFRRNDEASNAEVEEAGEEASGGGGRRDNTATTVHEISSENSGLIGRSSRSDDGLFDEEAEPEGGDDVEGDDGVNNKKNKKKRKRYHRHTAEQIREMEALFKESPHPDEKQRQQLSKQLGLAPRQVKFWFQNRRTQIKAIQERHENLLLKSEIDKLREENEALRGIINKACCPNCGVPTISSSDASMPPEEHQLRVENAKLKSEIEKLRRAVGKGPLGMTTTSPSSSSLGNEQVMENRSCMEIYSGIFGLEKTRIMELVNKAMEELIKMATTQEPLWVRSVETGRQILNYDEYVKEFNVEHSSSSSKRYSIEASRETGVVFLDLPRILQIFLDVNQWKEMFPSLISKAAIVDVICSGEGANRDGAVQLMFSEVQMVTPMVGSREVYFVRYCKQLKEEEWAIVDVSIENVQDTIEASLLKCRKRPSGCIIQDTNNGHCKVTWVEHIECEKSTVHTTYRSIVKSGLAFGARRWLGTLQQQCQRLMFVMATNVPMKESVGVGTVAGRKSVMRLAQRMSKNFCHAVGASSLHTWSKYSGENGLDIRVNSRKNLNDRGEPLGLILCAVSCASLPLSPRLLVDFLRDETRRSQWQVTAGGEHVRSFVNLAKGKDRGNAVTIMEVKSKDESNCTWILQDSSTSTYESTVVYAPVDITRMQSVIAGRDSSDVPILPSGFSIIPDGLEAIRPLMITSSSSMHGGGGEGEEEEEKNTEGGSLLTIAFQVLVSTCPSDKLTHESLESVSSVMSCTLRNIKTSLQCEDS